MRAQPPEPIRFASAAEARDFISASGMETALPFADTRWGAPAGSHIVLVLVPNDPRMFAAVDDRLLIALDDW